VPNTVGWLGRGVVKFLMLLKSIKVEFFGQQRLPQGTLREREKIRNKQ